MENTSKNKNYTGIIIAIIVLAAILIILSIMPKKTMTPAMTNQDMPPNTQTMQQSDETDAIQSDIETGLQTDFETNDIAN